MFGEEKELFKDLNALLNGWETPIDLIACGGMYSANICSVGIDARIGVDVHKYSGIPLIGGATGYVVSTVVNVFKGITRGMRIQSGDFTASGEHSLVCACNGRYYGGGFNPSVTARPDDGVLDIYIIKAVNLPTLARLIGKYAAGKADELPQYVTHLRGDRVDIDFDEENVVNIDGEAIYAKSVSMRLVPGAMRLIVPQGMRFFQEKKEEAVTGV